MNGKTKETLEKDSELLFPHIFSVEASAGSGKTYTLTLRVLQFLLSNNIPNNKLTNILGITFTNNSAKDMKRQVLDKLKLLSMGLLDADTAGYISDIIIFGGENHAKAAEKLIGGILSNYHDFQIRTIDSFTSKILKASALEIGLPPDFEISTESSTVIDYAVENLIESAQEALLGEFLDLLNRNQTAGGIDFNPVKTIKDRMKYLLETESNYNSDFSFDFSFKERLDENLNPVLLGLQDLLKIAEQQGFEIKGSVKQESIDKIKNYLGNKNYFGLVNERRGFPYKKQKPASGNTDYSKKWDELLDGFNQYLPDIAKLKNMPYLSLYESFKDKLKDAYKILGLVYISDINKKLSRFLTGSSVPEIYFHLGNVIYHYFIDEFQDTSKVQWQNLKPLIEESLSKGGSLFTVGDLKQALYGFRGADYKIMKSLLDSAGKSFPSAKEFKSVSLKTNFRSDKVLVDYVNGVFKNAVKEKVKSVGDPAGFLIYEQDTPIGETGKNINTGGYYSTEIFKFVKDSKEGIAPADESESGGELQSSVFDDPLDIIEERLIEIIEDLKSRNYNLGDIAVLAQKNRYLNDIGGRLIDKGYPVVAQSSLDIRNRKVIMETERLLNFLNSPMEDFNFGSFILGDVFKNALNRLETAEKIKYSKNEFEKFIFEVNLKNAQNNQNTQNTPVFSTKTKRPLYAIFKESYGSLWNEYFEELFNKTGYLPLYELVLYVYKIFNLPENFSDESAYLAHFLDIIQSVEESGSSNLNDLAELMNSRSDASSELFSIELPKVKNAVTLLTVHKAKGLQWDAVINVFFAEENYALKSSEANSKSNKGWNKNDFAAGAEQNAAVSSLDLLYITKKMFEGKKDAGSKSDYLESIYNAAVKDENISDLNNFYVALTRAKHEMYNLIISKDECALPLSSSGTKPLMKPDDKKDDKGAVEGGSSDTGRIELDCGYCDIGFESAIKTGSQYLSIKRGDFYHGVLSEIKYTEDFENLDALIEKYMVLLRIKNNGSNILETKKGIKEKIMRIKENEFLLKLFDKKIYEVFTEKEYLSASGIVCRMDRVSVPKESGGICILDYKTGDMNKKEAESYKAQLFRYKSVLKDIYKDKKISAVIYNIDKSSSFEC
ncbi:MAG: UvrD-helicase domain-containing protein [bacterium]